MVTWLPVTYPVGRHRPWWRRAGWTIRRLAWRLVYGRDWQGIIAERTVEAWARLDAREEMRRLVAMERNRDPAYWSHAVTIHFSRVFPVVRNPCGASGPSAAEWPYVNCRGCLEAEAPRDVRARARLRVLEAVAHTNRIEPDGAGAVERRHK